MPRFEPYMDSFGDSSPSGLKHHVVTHVGEDLCLGTVNRSGATNLALGDEGVVLGSQYQHRDTVDLFALDQIEGEHVKEASVALVVESLLIRVDLLIRRRRGEEQVSHQFWVATSGASLNEALTLTNGTGWRRAMRRVAPSTPVGGTDATRMAPAAVWCYRYF